MSISSQFIKVVDGDYKNLKEIKEYEVLFDYTDVMIPKFDSESDFLADKMSKREEKEVGAGEVFKESWFNDRPLKYHPSFINEFNNTLRKTDVKIPDQTQADYVIYFRTKIIYPGYNVGVSSKSAYVNFEISVYSKNNPNEILLKAMSKKHYGSTAYNGGDRIAESYASAGRDFAYQIKKKALKD